MARIKVRKVSKEDRMKYLDLLWTSIAELRSREEVKNFFKDLLSESEAIMLARRIMIARYLLEEKGYDEIQEIMETSPATIAKVHQWLISGFGGYEKALKRFEKEFGRRMKAVKEKQAPPFSFDWIRRKYPLHFLLVNLLLDSGTGKGKKSKK